MRLDERGDAGPPRRPCPLGIAAEGLERFAHRDAGQVALILLRLIVLARFEVLTETGRVRLADGTDGGRQFALVEVIDLARPGEADRLRRELDGSAEP